MLIPITIDDLTFEERESIFRAVQHEYHMQDADAQVRSYLDWHVAHDNTDNFDELYAQFDMEELATQFEHCESADVAENETWEYVIDTYIDEHHIDM